MLFVGCIIMFIVGFAGTHIPHFNKQVKIIKKGRRYSIQKRMLFGNFKEFDYEYDYQTRAETTALAYMTPKPGPEVVVHLK